jgi:peptidoglycan/LPS O-acetylase OafA/YrhL
LRALAVTGVMLSHWAPGLMTPFNTGVTGVRVFFVISGFLITDILLRRRAVIAAGGSGLGRELKTFYARRTLRIFPPYYAAIAIALVVGLFGNRQIEGLGWHLVFLSNLYIFQQADWPPHFVRFWSLAVEEQFYLVWPAIVFLTPARALRPVLAGLILAAGGVRAALFLGGFDPMRQIGVLLPSCLDPLCFGALLAAALHARALPSSRRLAWIGGAGLAVWVALSVGSLQGRLAGVVLNNFVLGALSFAVLGAIVSGRHARAFAWLNWAPLQFLGRRSYGVYLYHPFGAMLADALTHHSLSSTPRIAAAFVAALGIAQVSWLALERPALSLKARFRYGDFARPKPPAHAEVERV